MKNNTMRSGERGFAPIIAIIVAVLVLGGGAYYVMTSSPAVTTPASETDTDDISVTVPDINFSFSPVPDLNISSVNVGGAPTAAAAGTFSAPTVDTKFDVNTNMEIKSPSFSASDINIEMPKIPVNIPANIPTGNIPSVPPQGAPSGMPPAGGGAPSVDCSMFASVPSCSMTGPGEAMCKQCFPNK